VKPRLPLVKVLTDPALLGGVLRGNSWKPWLAVLAALFALPLTAELH
jgi:hypothetical protein